jgi:transcriptional regulator with XRE-family HTH domain
MPKTIHRHEYAEFLRLIRESRQRAGVTQAQCSDALGRSQSFMSDVERGTRRLDLIQVRDLCKVLGTDLPKFVRQLEQRLRERRQR